MKKIISVGIDIRDLQIAATGTRTFLENICLELGEQQPGFRFYYFNSRRKAYTGNSRILKLTEHFHYLLWKQLILPWKAWRNKCDIVFCSDFFVPFFCPGFVTIPVFHDAFFWEYPAHYNRYWLSLFRSIGVAAAKKAAFIVTPTAYTRDRITHFSGINTAKIIPVFEAPKPLINSNEGMDEPENTVLRSLLHQGYILHVGTFEKRKNIPRLVSAFALLRQRGFTAIKLVLAGQSSNKQTLDDSATIEKLITEKGLQEQVIRPGYISDKDLAYCYRHANMYALPSLNEGFGIPLLEAFQHQLPVIIANNSCLPEVAGDAALSFDPYDETAIADAMQRLLEDPALREQLIKKGTERLSAFSWKKTADTLLSVFERAARY